jgi:hypothetical protein
MRAVVPIEHDWVRGLVAVGIIVEPIGQRVRDQLLVLIIAAVTELRALTTQSVAICPDVSVRGQPARVKTPYLKAGANANSTGSPPITTPVGRTATSSGAPRPGPTPPDPRPSPPGTLCPHQRLPPISARQQRPQPESRLAGHPQGGGLDLGEDAATLTKSGTAT